MKSVLETDGLAWNLLETQADADEEGRLGQTAVHIYFSHDAKQGNKSAYYGLRKADGSTLVTVRISDNRSLPVETQWVNDKTIVVGQRNSDPYVDYAQPIAALAEHLGIDLPSSCWPYGRHVEEIEDAEEVPAGPTP